MRNVAIEENWDIFRISPFKVGTTNKVWRCQHPRTILRKSLEETNRVTRSKRSKIESKERSRVAVYSSNLTKLSIRVNGRAEIYIRYVKPEKNSYSTRLSRQVRSFIHSPVGSSVRAKVTSCAIPDIASTELGDTVDQVVYTSTRPELYDNDWCRGSPIYPHGHSYSQHHSQQPRLHHRHQHGGDNLASTSLWLAISRQRCGNTRSGTRLGA